LAVFCFVFNLTWRAEMAIPDPPIDLTTYNDTLEAYNTAGANFDAKSGERDTAYAALISAQQTYDAANVAAQSAADDASTKLTSHIAAANEVGIPSSIPPAL